MGFEKLQKDVDQWTSQFTPQYWTPHEIATRLMEEVGELAREINHLYGPKKKKNSEETRELGDEIADIFFTLVCLANSKGINLDDSWKRMIDKYSARDNNRYTKK